MTPLVRELLDRALPQLTEYAVVLLDPAGIVIGWLGGAEVTFGYREAEIVGCHSSTLFVPQDIELGLDRYELEVARQDSYAHDDRWHLRADGTRIWVSGSVTAIRDDAGTLLGFLKIMRDRTDQRMNAENRANRLDAAMATLERTQRFLQTLGHELRNPLAPIKNSADILVRVSEDARVHQVAKIIRNQASVLERLTGDLMDVARMEHKKLQLKLAEFDVRRLIEEQVVGFAAMASSKGVRLKAVVPEKPLLLHADADRIRQAVTNLLGNALKYTPEGGDVWAKVTQEGDDIVIRVEDSGIGIPSDVLPRVFDLFTQESRAMDLVPGGLGVGLAIVKQIAELHGGVAQARSPGIGKGSEFMMRLPKAGPTPLDVESGRPGSSV